jgi:hypothetical protein
MGLVDPLNEQAAEWGGVRIFEETVGQRSQVEPGAKQSHGIYAYNTKVQAAVAKFFGCALDVEIGGKQYSINKDSARHYFNLGKEASDADIKQAVQGIYNHRYDALKRKTTAGYSQVKDFLVAASKVPIGIMRTNASAYGSVHDKVLELEKKYKQLTKPQKQALSYILDLFKSGRSLETADKTVREIVSGLFADSIKDLPVIQRKPLSQVVEEEREQLAKPQQALTEPPHAVEGGVFHTDLSGLVLGLSRFINDVNTGNSLAPGML